MGMEKIINIDGRDVKFKSTGATPLRYKSQFGKDFFREIMTMFNDGKPDLTKFDIEIFYNIAWVLAKTANKDIPEPIEWFDSFSDFPVMEVLPQLQDLIYASMMTQKK